MYCFKESMIRVSVVSGFLADKANDHIDGGIDAGFVDPMNMIVEGGRRLTMRTMCLRTSRLLLAKFVELETLEIGGGCIVCGTKFCSSRSRKGTKVAHRFAALRRAFANCPHPIKLFGT